MEHSLLHGIQLCGLIFALGGALFRLFVLRPALGEPLSGEIAIGLLNRWIVASASLAGLASGLDLYAQGAELDGRTIYSGVSWSVLEQYLTATIVGRLGVLKAALFATAALIGWRRLGDAPLLAVLVGAGFSSALVSHAAALPEGREWAIAGQFVHIMAAAFWLGMLGALFLTVVHFKGRENEATDLLGNVVARFSPFALATIGLLVISGIYSALRFIRAPEAILTSAYGLTLALKLVLLSVAVYAGYVNWRRTRPSLKLQEAGAVPRLIRFMEMEFSAGIMVVLVAGILGAISPPFGAGSGQLTSAQITALLTPRLPPAQFIDPATFVGAPERTLDDLRYSEFTHQWSGVFVAALGLCWWGQMAWRRGQRAYAKIWPSLLICFGVFIAIVADPEIFILKTFSASDVFANPQLLEHQTGALLVFILAGLGFRDYRRAPKLRPLGYGFPMVMIAGSFMLLGHAHANFTGPEELGTLINVQHAVIGALGVLAGMCRWFQMRDLPGSNLFGGAWPPLLILLGLLMAFCYREAVPVEETCEPAEKQEQVTSLARRRLADHRTWSS